MKSSLEINGKKLLSIKRSSELVSYSRDYITRLAREGKIVATHIGRNWYIDIDSLKNYELSSQQELEIRKRMLSEERKRDLKIKEIKKSRKAYSESRIKNAEKSAVAFSSLVVVCGLLTGFWLEGFIPAKNSYSEQVASVSLSEPSVLDIQNKDITVQVFATPEPELPVEFAQVVQKRQFSSADSGIFLLPTNSEGLVIPETLFSDEVIITENENGQPVLMLVDADGNPYGEQIPFLQVPSNQDLQ